MTIFIDGFEIDLTTFSDPVFVGDIREVKEEDQSKIGRVLIFADRLIASK